MYSKTILVGRVGQNPTTREINNTKNATFSLATSQTYKAQDGSRKEQTEWHNIVTWRALADIVEKYVHKGDLLCITGHIHYRTWDDDKGVKHYSTDIVADEMRMLGGKTEGKPTPNAKTATRPYLQGEDIDSTKNPDDDLPF